MSESATPTAELPVLLTTRAKAELSLQVLSYNDVKMTSPAQALFLVHHITKEVLAVSNIFRSAQSIGVDLKL